MNLKIFTDNIEEKALQQIKTLMAQPAFADCKVRIMPDVHAGAGCVIGFTADLGDKVIPNIVGVDIGCGMLTANLGKIDIDFDKLDDVIHENIPYGMNVYDEPLEKFYYLFSLNDLYCHVLLKNKDWLEKSLGTLGGGNHFIEVDQDEEGNKYLVIHTGSRNLGKQVADIWQNIAVAKMSGLEEFVKLRNRTINKLKEEHREQEIPGALKQLKETFKPIYDCPKDLCWLEGEDREHYLHDMAFCQEFASWNRVLIMREIQSRMGWKINADKDVFETIHNYIELESNIVRKGAISAKEGERVLIPMNMRDGCIIGIGKGNEDWNCSAPHGAGRIMSRAQAKMNIPIADYRASMDGIWSSTVTEKTLDESPMAYKPMDEILKYIGPTIEVERIIKPVYNFKASE